VSELRTVPEGTCSVCRHASHNSIGFCPNMASDCDCPGEKTSEDSVSAADVRAQVQAVIDARYAGDFSAMIPKLQAIVAGTFE